jgi:DNA-binding NarL/FixJ family response regulator
LIGKKGWERALRVLIAEDHKGVRKLLKIVLKQDGNIEVVDETGDGLQAVKLAQTLQPDVALMDIRLPGLDGLEATRRIKATSPPTRVIIMSMHDEDAYIYEALAAGASGYVVKSDIQNIGQAIISVHVGKIYLTPPISLQRIENYRSVAKKPPLEVLQKFS